MSTAIQFKFADRTCFAAELTARQIDQVLGGPARQVTRKSKPAGASSETAAADPAASDQAAADRDVRDQASGMADIPSGETPGDDSVFPPGRGVEAAVPPDPSGGFHIFDLIFHDEPVSSLAVTLSTGLTDEDLAGDVSPLDLEAAMLAVKEANPFLVRAVNNGVRMAEEFETRMKKILASRSGERPTN